MNNIDKCSIVLYNAESKIEAKRIRKELLEERLIRGGFIVLIEPGFLGNNGDIIEEDEFYVVFCHTISEKSSLSIEMIEEISESKAMSWDLKEGSDNYVDWVMELKNKLL